MKHKFGYVLAAASLVVAGCNDAEYSVPGPQAFFAESINTIGVAGKALSVGKDGVDVSLTVSLTDKTDKDAVLRIEVDQEVLAQYNQEQSSGYEVLPADLYTLPQEDIVIKAGEYSTDPLTFHIKQIPAELSANAYGLPLKIKAVSGDVEATSLTSGYAFVIPPVLINDLACFDGASGLKVDDFNGAFKEFTIEAKFQISNTGERNRDVFVGGKVLLRFEDPQNPEGDTPAHSLVQFQGDGGYKNPSKPFESNKWQHLACTYNGTKITLYVNGSPAGEGDFAASVVGNGEFPTVGWFGGAGGGDHGLGDTWWRGCKIMFTEARVWSVCRTEDQIKNNMAYVSPTTAGLEGYWRINKTTYNEETKSFEDLSGKGHPLVTDKTFTWKENISAEDEATPWE